MLSKVWLQHHDVMELNKRGPILLIELEHEGEGVTDVVPEPISESSDTCCDQLLAVIFIAFLVESCNILHDR